MYNLTIHFGPNAVAWSFLFKDDIKARAVMQTFLEFTDPVMDRTALIEDDYGQTAYIALSYIHGVLLEDMDLGQEARIIRGLDHAKGQARANKRAMSDPEIQALQREQRGPSVLTPFPSGVRHQ